MDRKISISLYALAFVISLVIFLIGVYFGTVIDKINKNNIKGDVDQLTAKLSSTQILLLSDDKELACVGLTEELNNVDKQIDNIGNQLAYLEENKGFVDVELKKQYFMLETNSYLLSTKQQEKCGQKNKIILYFYSNKNCSSCKKQGIDLTEARSNINNTKTYSFDGELGSLVVDALKNKYNITNYPTIVIDSRVLAGTYNKEQILSELKK